MGLKVEFANLAYLKTDDENDTQATDEQYVQARFRLVSIGSATNQRPGKMLETLQVYKIRSSL